MITSERLRVDLRKPPSVKLNRTWGIQSCRHHKRRLVNPGFAEVVASRLVPGGVWRLATDWADYAEAMRETLDSCDLLANLHPGWAPRYELRPLTKYEQRGLDAGRTVFDLAYTRR